MGTLQSRAQKMERFNKIHHDKWDIIRQEGLTQIAVDTKGREGEVNVVKIDPKRKLEHELEVYYYRRTHEGPLVKCYGAESLKTNSVGICGVENTMKVITQRIIKRFGQLPQLTLPEIIYSLGQALEGYKTLFKEAGAFEVNPNMLGINNKGDLHVWLNENFADNNPKLEKGILYTTAMVDQLNGVSTEKEMVDNILHMVQAKCEQGRFPQDFSSQMYNNSNTFDDALLALQDYTTRSNIAVPDKIHPDNSKMYISKTKGMQVTQANKSTVGKQQSYKFESSPNNEIKKYQFESSPGKQFKREQFAGSFGNQVYQTKYVNNSSNQIMTPKHQTYQSKQVNNISGGNQAYSPSSYNYNYNNNYSYNNNSYSDAKVPNWSITNNNNNNNNNDLRTNPNVNAAQSVYQSKQTISPVKDISIGGYTFSNNKDIDTSPNRVYADSANKNVTLGNNNNGGSQAASPARITTINTNTNANNANNANNVTNTSNVDKNTTYGTTGYSTGVPSYTTNTYTTTTTTSNRVVTSTPGLKADVLSKSPAGVQQIKNTYTSTSGTAPKTTFTFSSNSTGAPYQYKQESWTTNNTGAPVTTQTITSTSVTGNTNTNTSIGSNNYTNYIVNDAGNKNIISSPSYESAEQARNKAVGFTSQYTGNPVMETSQVTKF